MKIVCNIHFTESNDVDLNNPDLDVFEGSDVDQAQANGDGRNQLPSNTGYLILERILSIESDS